MKKALFVLAVLMMAMCLLVACGSDPATDDGGEAKENLQVAFVYNDVIGDYGWFYGHEQGRIAAEEALDFVDTIYLESVAPGSTAERVITDLATEGYDVIIGASADFEADITAVAPNFPDTVFLICCGATSNGTNVESFYPTSYELWYLMGILAAQLPDVDCLGIVGAVNSPMDLQVQNAFILGAKTVNPEIQERIIYTNTYYDPAAERDAALSLIDAGADVIAQSTNSTAHVQACQENGVFAMSMYEDMRAFGPDVYVTGEVFNWGVYYINTFQAIYDGTFDCHDAGTKWLNFAYGAMEFAEYGAMVTDEMIASVEAAKEAVIADGSMIWTGPIVDTKGEVRVAEGEVMTDAMFTAMDWWVEGVITAGAE